MSATILNTTYTVGHSIFEGPQQFLFSKITVV
jgi:hypothetical protein